METVELRDLDQARAYLLQGLWLQRVVRPTAATVRPALDWALEIVASGQPLPPIGLVADLGNLVYGDDRARAAKDAVDVPGWPATLARSYEDHLLGKIYADWTFERATDALRRYTGRDQGRGLAYVLKQIRERAGLGGVELSPATVRGLAGTLPDELLARGYELLSRDGPMPLLVSQYEKLVSAARRLADVLGPEDVIALEQRTALADLGQYVAHRQVLQVTAAIEARLPPRPVRALAGRKEVPTRILDEDQYPVGGYTSIATKGSIESLLHSQLAYMEEEQPDLFDMKFVRDELFYYSRDENQFLRRRRTFAFLFQPDLAATRFKDAELPCQRVVMLLGLALAAVRRVSDWLSTDALQFELLFVGEAGESPLAHERELMQLLLQELQERGAATVRTIAAADLPRHLAALAGASQLQALDLAVAPGALAVDGAVVTRLAVAGAFPTLTDGHGKLVALEPDDAIDYWAALATRLLELWV